MIQLFSQACATGNGIQSLHQIRSFELQMEIAVKTAAELEVVSLTRSIASSLRNPFYLDSKSGIDWTLNPFSTGQ